MDMILCCLFNTLTFSMELSSKSLECLEVFRKRIFEDDEHIRMVGQTTMDMLFQKSNQSSALSFNPSTNTPNTEETEDSLCQYGLSSLFLQSARHGLESDELRYSE